MGYGVKCGVTNGTCMCVTGVYGSGEGWRECWGMEGVLGDGGSVEGWREC